MENIGIGIEIECILDNSRFNIEAGEYHEGNSVRGLPNWDVEEDSSISTDEEENLSDICVEFVSPVFHSVNSFRKGLNSFYNKFSENGNLELKEVLVFNKSCGSHLHFSIKGLSFGAKAIYKIFPKIRKKFKKLILVSEIGSKRIIVEHYNRGYAREITEHNFKYGRESEFNFQSENVGMGIEWRSLNMLGVNTWKEFFNFWEIVIKCLRYFYKIVQKYSFSNTIMLVRDKVINKKEIEEFLKQKQEKLNLKLQKKTKIYSNFKIELNLFKDEKIFINTSEENNNDIKINIECKNMDYGFISDNVEREGEIDNHILAEERYFESDN